jgi:hypothetical protein
MTRLGWVAAFAGLALTAACQPLPHPFEDDRPPAALLRIRDTAGISIAPIDGIPTAVAGKLGPELAKALLQHDIPATDKTTSLRSYPLYGRLVQSPAHDGKATVTALWRLYDARGRTIGERKVQLEATADEWAKPGEPTIGRLATLSADAVAPLVEDDVAGKAATAPSKPPLEQRIRVAVVKISGAPGDGDKALATAVANVLKRQDLDIVAADGKPDLLVDCEVAVSPVKADRQHIKITWRVRRPDGVEIGTAGQENDVPRGLLEGPWGDLAYTVALAAGEGLMQLVARGAPERKS